MCTQDVPRVPGLRERRTVHEEGFRVSFLEVHYGKDHGLYLGLDVVGLVDHVVDASALLGLYELDVDQEEFERVDGAYDQVVVSVLAVVEVETPEPVLVEEQGDYMLHVDALGVMAEVHQHLRPISELLAHGERRAPVR